eukprot:16421-Heterococcus_DN1.PRE.2
MSTFSMPSGSATTSSHLACTMCTMSLRPFAATICFACTAIALHSMPMTHFAPARAQNIDRMPVPQPTSSTTCSAISGAQ